ncbi:unnamed protein product [Prunus armeniaca]|uniref:Uncharacterized protein n=1 Tax=Prunus armeniaca TaxID=36596 RepID=A0A6J5X9B2_PRUAR|nr:unnamed protein product [Prunus armeniaca]CAB4310530.1 unnamed protein product [Prunus armeniaca]
MRGRFCCAVANPTIKEIAIYFQENYKEYKMKIAKELPQGPEEGTKRDFTKLAKMGFEYKYGMKDVLDDSVACGRLFIWSSFSQVI